MFFFPIPTHEELFILILKLLWIINKHKLTPIKFDHGAYDIFFSVLY